MEVAGSLRASHGAGELDRGCVFQVNGLVKSYGQREVLKSVSLAVANGEVYGFVGGNGAGKTTAMRIMLGVSRPDAGAVYLDGRVLDDVTRSAIGYMPEERGLYPKMTLVAQLTHFGVLHGIARRSASAAADYWLDRLGLGDRRNSALESLSLGNQQRVQLAAALVHEPRALILDEPFSGLDPLAVDVISEVLREEARRGVPVVFSSHQLELVERLCDRIGILRDGRFVAEGTVADLGATVGRQVVIRTPVLRQEWLPDLLTMTGPLSGRRVTVQASSGDETRLGLHGDIDSQEVLDAVRRRGRVEAFFPWHPTLHEIYSGAVMSEPTPDENGVIL
jgi:ABC-2 type transport system ATP-binding protein